MRYTLRNKDKIEKEYGDQVLNNIVASLDDEFSRDIKLELLGDDQYKMIVINDLNHTSGLIVFYLIKKTFDVCLLAFKEFVS